MEKFLSQLIVLDVKGFTFAFDKKEGRLNLTLKDDNNREVKVTFTIEVIQSVDPTILENMITQTLIDMNRKLKDN